MPKSMTAFGRAAVEDSARRLSLEIKSVNHRYFEPQFRLPRVLQGLEGRLREKLAQRVSRGKIELRVNYSDLSGDTAELRLDRGLALAYDRVWRELCQLLDEERGPLAPLLLSQSELFIREEKDADEEVLWLLLSAALDEALSHFDAMRKKEAATLSLDIEARLDELAAQLEKVKLRAPELPRLYREKLERRVLEMLKDCKEEYYPGQRIAAEVAIFADRADIQEELLRLQSHIDQFREMLRSAEAVGKSLDFIIQEMLRESNTIGSKANDLEITRAVLQMKTLIEQIREQIQNLE